MSETSGAIWRHPTPPERRAVTLRAVSAVLWVLAGIATALVALAIYDLLQRRHALLRAYPVVGRARFMLEKVGPELRQYWFQPDKAERPFDRTERNWVYESAKHESNTFG